MISPTEFCGAPLFPGIALSSSQAKTLSYRRQCPPLEILSGGFTLAMHYSWFDRTIPQY